jgi:hypothetical protein
MVGVDVCVGVAIAVAVGVAVGGADGMPAAFKISAWPVQKVGGRFVVAVSVPDAPLAARARSASMSGSAPVNVPCAVMLAGAVSEMVVL